MKDGRPKRGIDRDLALKVLALCSAVKDALDDLLGSMFIIYQPKSTTGSIGDTATFTVVAMNVTSYQWEVYVPRQDKWGNSTATGSQTDTLSFEIASGSYTYKWRCKLTDSEGNSIYTDEVILTEGS